MSMLSRNKKGEMGTFLKVMIGVMAFAVVSLVGGIWYYLPQFAETQYPDTGSIDDGTDTPPSSSEVGDLVSAEFNAYDFAADNPKSSAVKVPLNVWEKGTSELIEHNTLLSTSARTAVDLVKGRKYIAIAFNDTYLGIEKEIEVTKDESFPVDLEVYKHCLGMEVLFYDRNSPNKNLTLVAGGQDDFDSVEVKNNGTDCAYNYAGMYFNTVVESNISNIDMKGASGYNNIKKQSGMAINRVKEKDDYVFLLVDDEGQPDPQLLLEGEKWVSGLVTVSASGSYVSTTDDCVEAFIFDYAPEVSAKPDSVPPVIWGYEDNQQTTTDVGAPDIEADSFGTSSYTFCLN